MVHNTTVWSSHKLCPGLSWALPQTVWCRGTHVTSVHLIASAVRKDGTSSSWVFIQSALAPWEGLCSCLLHILWGPALSVCLSCTALRWYFNTNMFGENSSSPTSEMGCAGISSSFRSPLKGNGLEQLYQVFLLLFLTCTLSLCCRSLDTPDILCSPCIAMLMRFLIKLTSKLPMTVLAKLLIKVLKHNDTLTLSFSLVKSIRLTI